MYWCVLCLNICICTTPLDKKCNRKYINGFLREISQADNSLMSIFDAEKSVKIDIIDLLDSFEISLKNPLIFFR